MRAWNTIMFFLSLIQSHRRSCIIDEHWTMKPQKLYSSRFLKQKNDFCKCELDGKFLLGACHLSDARTSFWTSVHLLRHLTACLRSSGFQYAINAVIFHFEYSCKVCVVNFPYLSSPLSLPISFFFFFFVINAVSSQLF